MKAALLIWKMSCFENCYHGGPLTTFLACFSIYRSTVKAVSNQ